MDSFSETCSSHLLDQKAPASVFILIFQWGAKSRSRLKSDKNGWWSSSTGQLDFVMKSKLRQVIKSKARFLLEGKSKRSLVYFLYLLNGNIDFTNQAHYNVTWNLLNLKQYLNSLIFWSKKIRWSMRILRNKLYYPHYLGENCPWI